MTRDEFISSIKLLGVDVNDEKLELLDRYYDLLIEWNEKINLTSITDLSDVYLKHFYDSLSILKVINLNDISNLCDVGTGAGFPGIVLKIFYPDLDIVLVDALEKRVKFLNLVISELGLKKIKVYHARCEDFSRLNINKFDLVLSRAVGKSNMLIEMMMPMVKINGLIILYKGRDDVNLTHALSVLNASLVKRYSFKLKNGDDRMFVIIGKDKDTNKKYPRKFSDIKKRPL